MISLNEVATLANQLAAIRDDSRSGNTFGGIISLRIHDESSVLLSIETFLSEFVEYGVQVYKNTEIRLHQSIFGVDFQTIIPVSDVIKLRVSMPEHHEYIVRQIQLEKI